MAGRSTRQAFRSHGLILVQQRVEIGLLLQGTFAGAQRRLQLRLNAVQDLDVALQFRRQRAFVLGFESVQLGFLVGQRLGSGPGLRVKEQRGGFRLLLAGTHVFVDEERGQLGVHLLGGRGVWGLVIDLEGNQFSLVLAAARQELAPAPA